MSVFSPARCVFLLNDEGLAIYDAGASRAAFIDTVPWNTQDFEDSVAEIVRKRCKGRSILLLNDMVEQHYRKERVPKVSPFDKANVIKRRVSAAFPSYPIRSALKLKERAPVREGKPGGEIYLLAAVPLSENIRKTLSAVQKCYAAVSGFCLLPVESSGMVHALSKKLAKVTEKAATWTVFVGQHRNGSLRQIVTKNGELALTRMTPIVDSDIDHDLWSAEVVSELKGTMSYLSRFGYDASDGLDVVVIANNSVADTVAAKIDFDCNLSVLTAQEAANLLGIRIGRQDDQRYADPLHIAWSGKKASFTMPLQASQLDKISGPARVATAASLVLLAACAYFGFEAFSSASQWAKNNTDLTAAQQAYDLVKKDHETEVAKKAAVGVDFLLIENSTKVFDALEKQSMRPLSVFDTIGRALGPDIHLTSLNVKPVAGSVAILPASDAPPVDPNAPPKQKEYEIVIKIIFPAELAPEVGVRKIDELQQRLRASLPSHQVAIIKQVADLSYTGNFVGEATQQVKTDQEKQDYEAQISIKGVLI